MLESRWRGILGRLRVTKAGRFSADAKKCPQFFCRARISYYAPKTMITLTMLVMEKIIKFMKMKMMIIKIKLANMTMRGEGGAGWR